MAKTMIETKLLTREYEQSYMNLLLNCSEAMLFHSINYRDLLSEFLGCEACYVIASEDGVVVGALPVFIKENRRYGNVLNSLPFFGSHGGFLVKSDLGYEKKTNIKMLLLERFNTLASEKDCILSTIITSPLDLDCSFYEHNLNYKYKDNSVAQIVEFREGVNDAESEIMYNIVEPSNRRAIRRPLKNDVRLEFSNDFGPLYEMHSENMSSKCGSVKPLDFFFKVQRIMADNDYRLMYAIKDGIIIAGLLVFYFNNIVDYYTPALRYEYSIEQGNTFLIYQGMKQAINDGYKYWNFGGTRPEHTDLHKFKSRWGTRDYPYYYYVLQHASIDHILSLSKEQILEQYPGFYVIPFKELLNIGLT